MREGEEVVAEYHFGDRDAEAGAERVYGVGFEDGELGGRYEEGGLLVSFGRRKRGGRGREGCHQRGW